MPLVPKATKDLHNLITIYNNGNPIIHNQTAKYLD